MACSSKQRIERSQVAWVRGKGVERATKLTSEGLRELVGLLGDPSGFAGRRARILSYLGESLEIMRGLGSSD